MEKRRLVSQSRRDNLWSVPHANDGFAELQEQLQSKRAKKLPQSSCQQNLKLIHNMYNAPLKKTKKFKKEQLVLDEQCLRGLIQNYVDVNKMEPKPQHMLVPDFCKPKQAIQHYGILENFYKDAQNFFKKNTLRDEQYAYDVCCKQNHKNKKKIGSQQRLNVQEAAMNDDLVAEVDTEPFKAAPTSNKKPYNLLESEDKVKRIYEEKLRKEIQGMNSNKTNRERESEKKKSRLNESENSKKTNRERESEKKKSRLNESEKKKNRLNRRRMKNSQAEDNWPHGQGLPAVVTGLETSMHNLNVPQAKVHFQRTPSAAEVQTNGMNGGELPDSKSDNQDLQLDDGLHHRDTNQTSRRSSRKNKKKYKINFEEAGDGDGLTNHGSMQGQVIAGLPQYKNVPISILKRKMIAHVPKITDPVASTPKRKSYHFKPSHSRLNDYYFERLQPEEVSEEDDSTSSSTSISLPSKMVPYKNPYTTANDNESLGPLKKKNVRTFDAYLKIKEMASLMEKKDPEGGIARRSATSNKEISEPLFIPNSFSIHEDTISYIDIDDEPHILNKKRSRKKAAKRRDQSNKKIRETIDIANTTDAAKSNDIAKTIHSPKTVFFAKSTDTIDIGRITDVASTTDMAITTNMPEFSILEQTKIKNQKTSKPAFNLRNTFKTELRKYPIRDHSIYSAIRNDLTYPHTKAKSKSPNIEQSLDKPKSVVKRECKCHICQFMNKPKEEDTPLIKEMKEKLRRVELLQYYRNMCQSKIQPKQREMYISSCGEQRQGICTGC